MWRRKWWSNREREPGYEWVSEGLAADSGRREGPVLVSISPTWLLFPPPPLRIRRLLQAKRKISTDLSGLESLALPQGWKTQWENVCGSPDPKFGCQGGKLERQVGMSCVPEPQHWVWTGIHCSAGCPGALGMGVMEKKLEEGRMSVSMGWETSWVWIWLGFGPGLGQL